MKLELIHKPAKGQARAASLLFIHGMFHGAWCWEEFFLPFFAEQGYESYALSLRGHAGSEGQAELRWHSIADYVKDIEWAVSQIGAPAVIIGHSMGGFVTQKFLETNSPAAAVLLTSVPPTTIWSATLRVLAKFPMSVIKALASLNLYHIIATPEQTQFAFFSKDMPLAAVKKYHAQMNSESIRAYFDMLGLNLIHPQRVKTPLLALGAEDDAVISVNNVKSTAKAYGTRAEIFPKLAHDVMLEAGWKSVAERILEWLKEQEL